MALALVPTSKIDKVFNNVLALVNRIPDEHAVVKGQLQQLLAYVQSTWINGPMFTHKDWCVYGYEVRTNNHLEGSHARYSKNLGSATATFANLIDLLKEEAHSVLFTINEVYAGRSTSQSNKHAVARNVQLKGLWYQFQTGVITDAIELLDEITEDLNPPSERVVNLYDDPEDADEPEEQ